MLQHIWQMWAGKASHPRVGGCFSVVFVAGSLHAFAGQMWTRVLTHNPLTDSKRFKRLYAFLYINLDVLNKSSTHDGDHHQKFSLLLSYAEMFLLVFLTCSSLNPLQPLPPACSQRRGLTGKEDKRGSKHHYFCLKHLREDPCTFFWRKAWRWLRATGRTHSRGGMGFITSVTGSGCDRSWPGRECRTSRRRTWKDSS